MILNSVTTTNKAYAQKFNIVTKVTGWSPGQDVNLGTSRMQVTSLLLELTSPV